MIPTLNVLLTRKRILNLICKKQGRNRDIVCSDMIYKINLTPEMSMPGLNFTFRKFRLYLWQADTFL